MEGRVPVEDFGEKQLKSSGVRSPALGYGLAVIVTLLAILLRKLLDPTLENAAPFTAHFVAIMVAAWYGGLAPSLLALGALLTDYSFIDLRGSLAIRDLEHQVSLGLFVVVGVVVAVLSESLHAKDAAEAANRAKGAFPANMSHEIRTPLNGIIGITDMVLRSQLPAKQREFLTMVKDSGETLLTLIDRLEGTTATKDLRKR